MHSGPCGLRMLAIVWWLLLASETREWIGTRWHATRGFDDLMPCLNNTDVVIVGDSRAEQLYRYFVVTQSRPRLPFQASNHHLPPHAMVTPNVSVIWHQENDLYSDRGARRLLMLGETRRRTVLIQGAGLWELKRDTPLSSIRRSISALRAPAEIAQINPNVALYWLPMGRLIHSMLYGGRERITNKDIEWVDRTALDLLGSEFVVLDGISAIYRGTGKNSTSDGMHFNEHVQRAVWEVILTHYCQ